MATPRSVKREIGDIEANVGGIAGRRHAQAKTAAVGDDQRQDCAHAGKHGRGVIQVGGRVGQIDVECASRRNVGDIQLAVAGVGFIERVVDAQGAEVPHIAIGHIRVDGVFDQLFARERTQYAAGSGAPHLDRVVIGIERRVVAHGFERHARGLRLVIVVIFRLEVGHEVERGVPRTEVEQADLRVLTTFLIPTTAGVERQRGRADQYEGCSGTNSHYIHSIYASERGAN